MLIDLPQTIGGSPSVPSTSSFALNMYPIEGGLVDRNPWNAIQNLPTGLTSAEYYCRGLVVSADGERLYSIIGGNVYRVDSSGDVNSTTYTLIGTISYTQSTDLKRIAFAVGFNEICFTTGTKKYYIDTSADTLTEITTANLPDCTDVDFVDGRYIWTATDGESIHYSDVNAPATVQALSFFDAETRPDKNRKTAVIGNDVFVFGDRSIERFRSTGSSTAAFIRVPNSIYAVGYVGGIKKLSDRVFFVGAPVGGPPAVYQLSLQGLMKVSPSGVDEQLYMGDSSYKSGDAYIDSWHEFGRQVLHCNASVDINNEKSFYLIMDSATNNPYKWGYLDTGFDGGAAAIGTSGATPSAAFSISGAVQYKGDYYGYNYTPLTLNSVDKYLFKMQPSNRLNQSTDGTFDSYTGEKFTRGFRFTVRAPNDDEFSIGSVRISLLPITTSASTSFGRSGDTIKMWSYTDDDQGDTPTEEQLSTITSDSAGFNLFHTKREIHFTDSAPLVRFDHFASIVVEIEGNQRFTVEKVSINDN